MCDGILLVHGIELGLKAFLLAKDPDVQSVEDIRKAYGHNRKRLFDRCIATDDKAIFSDSVLRDYIKYLDDYYCDDGIEARCPETVHSFERYADASLHQTAFTNCSTTGLRSPRLGPPSRQKGCSHEWISAPGLSSRSVR
jgi:hypothetical protein